MRIQREGVEQLNNLLNKSINSKNTPVKGTVSEEGVKLLNRYINLDMCGEDLYETLNKRRSISYHYKKHVRKPEEERRSYNRNKYDYITPTEYFEYASDLAKSSPDFVIDKSIEGKEDIESIADSYINSSNSILKIDYDLTNNSNGKPMYAIFRRRSEYSPDRQDICLVDKRSNSPITVFPITNKQFYKYINSFLLDNIC